MPQVIRFSDHIETKSLDNELKLLSKTIDDLVKKFVGVIESTKQVNQSMAQQTTTQSQTNKAIKDTNTNLDILSKSEKETNKIREQANTLIAKARAERENENKSLIKAKLARQEQNKKIQDEIKLNKAAQGSYEQLNQRLKILTAQYQKMGKAEREGVKGQALQKQIQGLDKELKGLDAGIGKHTRNVGNYSSALSGLPGPMGRAASSVMMLGRQLLKMMLNPVVLFIAALTAAVYALGKAFKSTDAGATELAARFEQLKATSSVLKQRLSEVATGLIEWAKSDIFKKETWMNLSNTAKQAFTGIKEQMNAATTAAYQYEYAIDLINDTENEYLSQRAKNLNLIAKFEFEAQNRTLSIAQRKKALEEAIRIGEEETKRSIDFAKRKYEEELKYTAARYNVSYELLKQYVEADDIAGRQLLANNASIADARNKMGDDQAKKLEELYVKQIEISTRFFEENKRNVSRLSGFMETIANEAKAEQEGILKSQQQFEQETEALNQAKIDQQKKTAEARIKINEQLFQKELNTETERYLAGTVNKEEYEKEIVNITINALQRQLELTNLTADQRLALETQLLNAKKALYEKDVDNAEEADEKIVASAEEKYRAIVDAARIGFDTVGMFMDSQQENLELAYQHEIELAGNNAEFKSHIDKKYDKERRKLQREQAIAQKAEGIFSAIVNTATGVTSALELGPIGIPLSIVIGLLGAAQIAIIASQKIPKFWKGTPGLKTDTLAEFGDRGPEIVHEPGKMPYIAEKRTIDYLPKGTKIIPNYETEKILAGQGGMTDEKFNQLISEERKTRYAMQSQVIHQTLVTEKGFERQTIKGNNKIKWLSKYQHR